MFFIRSFEAVYNYVVEQVVALTTYIDNAITNLTTYVDIAITNLTTYIDDSVADVPKYVKRENISAADFEYSDLVRDESWHELDLSSIVPEGVTLIHLRFDSIIMSRNDFASWNDGGTETEYGCYTILHLGSELRSYIDLVFLVCDANRKIRYCIRNKFVGGLVTVRGWYI